jgi:quercetin dioxygenase-like cupin family protein
VAKGERTAREVATGEVVIQLLEGALRIEIANHQLTVRHDEAVVIPSGFSHAAEAIEDSFAVQKTGEVDQASDESLWAV